MARLLMHHRKGYSQIVILLLLLFGLRTGAVASSISEYQIKAAFLLNFTKFIDWPPEAFPNSDAPIILGILGSDPFGDSIKRLEQKRVKGRTFKVKTFKDIDNAETCHILFVSHSEKNDLQATLQFLQGRNILTVGETEGFAQLGGVINFIKVKNKIRFEINMSAAKQANLTISSKMLKLARIVREDK